MTQEMTRAEYIEYWKSMSADELIVRCGLYLDRIEELQRDNSIRNELLGSAQGDLKQATARIAELEAQMSLKWPGVWQPVEDGLIDVGAGRHLHIDEDGRWIGVTDLDGDIIGAFLPDGYAICRKAQPAA